MINSFTNIFWVMRFFNSWNHFSYSDRRKVPLDFDCGHASYLAKFAQVGDFDGDKRAEITITPDVPGTRGNDFWVMDYES